MGLLKIPKLVDYRSKVARHKTKRYPNRTNGIKSITDIAIHHSLTLRKLAGSNAEGYARFHVNNLGWPSIGYTYVIEADGTIKYVNDIAKKTYHVGNHNNYALGIVLSGDFTKEKPTKEQEISLRNLVAALQKKYPHMKNVKGHSDYSGYEWKQCPVFDYKKVLSGASVGSGNTNTSKPPSNSKGKSIAQMVQEVIDGKHGYGHANRRKSLGISNSEYQKVRNEVNKRLGASTTKPKQTKSEGKSIAQMADEVNKGLHGNGHGNRRKSLDISKSEYNKVRAEVNRRAGIKSTSKPKGKSISQMATEVINGNHGNGHAARRKSLGISQAKYNKVRAEVNKRLR